MIILATFIGALILFSYYLIVVPFSYWKNRGIECENPQFLIGNWGPVLFNKYSQSEFLKHCYDKYPDKKCVPLYQLLTPALIIKDLELIKQITVKDFDSFPERMIYVSEKDDPLTSKTLFFMPGGQEWKDIRSTLSPAFTRNKLKIMFNLLVGCAQNFTESFHQNKLIILEAKDTFIKVTNDIIATTAFGVECNTMKNQDNELFTLAKELFSFGGFLDSLKYLLYFISPSLAKLLKIRLAKDKPSQSFRKIVKETMTFREENQVIRPDMLHLMMEARKGILENDEQITHKAEANLASKNLKSILTDEVITAQAMVFYVAGYDTVSSALSFTVYELMLNPDIQERLFREIWEVSKNCNGRISYEELLDMKYLDMVISESLRKWSPVGLLDRKPIKPLNLSLENDKMLTIDKNVICYIPVYALHRDPKYWPEPEKFDPERFNDNNKSKIKPFSYLPFGVGPKSCIANRFALLTVKTILFYFLDKFEIVPVDKSSNPLILGTTFPESICAEDYWVGLKPRKML